MTTSTSCPGCGRLIQSGFRYCPECGASIFGETPVPDYVTMTSGHKDLGKARGILIALGLLGIGFGGLMAITAIRDRSDDALIAMVAGAIGMGLGVAVLVAQWVISRYRSESAYGVSTDTIGHTLMAIAGGVAVAAILAVTAAGAAFVFFFLVCLTKL